jgi:hypothetical protein
MQKRGKMRKPRICRLDNWGLFCTISITLPRILDMNMALLKFRPILSIHLPEGQT